VWAAEKAASARNGLIVADSIASERSTAQDSDHFFRLSPELLGIAGFDGYLKSINPAWTKTLGFSSAELLSKPSLEWVHPEDRDRTRAAALQIGKSETIIGFRNRCRCRDGTYRVLEWQMTPLNERQIIYVSGHDITESVATGEALRDLSESLATTLNSILVTE